MDRARANIGKLHRHFQSQSLSFNNPLTDETWALRTRLFQDDGKSNAISRTLSIGFGSSIESNGGVVNHYLSLGEGQAHGRWILCSAF